MKKRNLFVAMGLALSAGCFAQDDLTINLASGKKTYKIDDIKSIAFGGNNLKVFKQGSGSDAYQLGEIGKVSFDAATGVDGLKVADGKLSISVKAGSNLIEISGYDGKTRYGVAVYSLAGEKLLGYDSWKGEAVDISALPAGIYVFKINNNTLKFRK